MVADRLVGEAVELGSRLNSPIITGMANDASGICLCFAGTSFCSDGYAVSRHWL